MPRDIFDENNIQLDSNSPRDIFEENGMSSIPSAPNVPRGALDKIIGSPAFQGLLGFGDASRNFLSNTANLIPGVNIKPVKSGAGTSYDIGNIAGDVGTFLAGGETLDAARAASEGLPYIGKLASYLGKEGLPQLLGTTAGGAAAGAIDNPENKTEGALLGGGIGALSKAVPLVSGAIRKFNPEIAMHDTLEGLAQKGAEEKLKSKALYNQVIDKFGDVPVYNQELESIEKSSNPVSKLKASLFKREAIKPIYDQYLAEPTVRNAHQLQSQLGIFSRSIKGTDWKSGLMKENLNASREELNKAISNSLKNVSPSASNLYQQASEHYLKKVIPYRKLNDALNKLDEPTPKQVLGTISKTIKKSFPKNTLGGVDIPIVPEEVSKLKDSLSQVIKNKKNAQKFVKTAKPVVNQAIKYGSLGAGISLGGYGAKKLLGD
jgi:hypothetical protein